MPETDKVVSNESETGDGTGRSPSEGTFFILEEEQGPRSVEGGAEEDRPPAPQSAELQCESAAIPSPGTAEVLAAISTLREELGERIDALRSTFEREVRTEAGRERILDRLHAELQEYKQDLLLKIQRPIFLDLIQLHDDVGKMAAARAGAESQPDVPGTELRCAISSNPFKLPSKTFSIVRASSPSRSKQVNLTPNGNARLQPRPLIVLRSTRQSPQGSAKASSPEKS